eukprot:CAMPEP_0201579390 /NCGR_PEP_ID=MMETSP0190_2-20130828/26906_1 /ASSEMBLY_ACC=CAM_ASM_000263 /TAXON_ID=37353 /ORGANISM="Rosalina sp." /LENGTH=269 /DNA_ID=CAMNT_0048013751 /DNA_START=142 /DNA_END=951 /DNA_ORIENTATION=-
MIRVSILALVIALSNAEASRRLLQTTTGAPAAPQTGTGVTPPEVPPPPATGGNPGAPPAGTGNPPPVAVPPVSQQPPQVPAQPQPQPQPAPAQPNPYQAWINYYCNYWSQGYDQQDCAYYQMMSQQYQYQPQPQGQAPGQAQGGNPMQNMYCNPMSPYYDVQDCMLFGGGFGGQGQAPGQGGINSNIPYCNQLSPYYDPQDCMQYSMMYPSQPAAPAAPGHGHPHGNPNQAPVQPNRPGQVNPMNPYCNPHSGMYDAQDCMQSTYGFHI